jgi:hypothetical protein
LWRIARETIRAVNAGRGRKRINVGLFALVEDLNQMD